MPTETSLQRPSPTQDSDIPQRRWRRAGWVSRRRWSLIRLAYQTAQKAFERQMENDLDEAASLYRKSIRIHPTAEAYTFLGWTYSLRGDYQAAIRQCRRAIRVDPSFGNPYNDIGAYLIELGRWEEAVPWLRQAIRAPRYDARHYPYMNLGRVYERKLDWDRARAAFLTASTIAPHYTPAVLALRRMLSRLN